jgi:putative ABC transport system ATP-binding protein
MSETSVPAIELEHVEKSFAAGRARVLSDVSLRVDAGELVVLVGPSGSGKSTTLHLVAALTRADAGHIRVFGNDITRGRHLNAHRRDMIGIVFQLHNLLPHLDARRNVEIVMMGTHRRRADQRAHADELLRRLDLVEHTASMPPELSGGERQRVAVARAFANSPRVILADEPTGSLDDTSAARVVDLLREHCTQGGAVLAVSHDPRLTVAADRVVRIQEGVAAEMPGGPADRASSADAVPRPVRPGSSTARFAST